MISATWMLSVMLLANPAVAENDRGSRPPPSGVAAGQKVCSAVVPSEWRDSINVPASWNANTCADWARSIGAADYQLGCFFEVRRNTPGFSWGQSASLNGAQRATAPSTNCGW
ncbi:hypothetical protein POL68_28530 [Stigmatella sp. ncwal1]|uniref:Uncharacterized protein n=1 Tax=Stigmatella ashevillensis TaxID=2995309 RepID=A0ABT5DJC1_9BACT|nr:hypothetical protein [Stigmatella ashevillena]MDC0712442.1 hypothetical protein [Stigmatella ashevillena]